MKAWFQRFMSGRYGSDTFGNFLCVTALVCLVIGLFVGIFYYIGLLLLLYAYFRMLSRNVHKRYAENIAFMQKTAGVRAKFGQLQQRFALRKTYRYFSCPHCRYYLRFWLSICRTSLAVSALRIMRYCPKGFPFTSMKG